MDTRARIRVVVVDDSALVRGLLAEIINRQTDMQCVGAAADPLAAREMIRALNPDVITLDVEMPRMDGIDFLSRLMRLRPTPVVMVSTLTERGAEVTLRALELGAVDFVAKPQASAWPTACSGWPTTSPTRSASRRARRCAGWPAAPPPAEPARKAAAPAGLAPMGRLSTEKLIFIGASTGGTEATKAVLMELPADSPAILITQHMPPGFTTSYAKRLDCAVPDPRQGGQRRRARAARPRLPRARRLASVGGAQRAPTTSRACATASR